MFSMFYCELIIEILLVFILLKFKKHPNISGIRVVLYVQIFAFLWPFSDPAFSQTTIGRLCIMPACYWSNYFSVFTVSKYESNRKTKPKPGHFMQFRHVREKRMYGYPKINAHAASLGEQGWPRENTESVAWFHQFFSVTHWFLLTVMITSFTGHGFSLYKSVSHVAGGFIIWTCDFSVIIFNFITS